MIKAKLHLIGGEALLAACDVDLFGTVIEDDSGVTINLKGSFFDGTDVDKEEFCNMLCQCTSANLVGKDTVAIAVELKLVEPENIKDLKGVPHALVFQM